MIKWMGLFCIVISASAVGFGYAGAIKRQIAQTTALLTAVRYMKEQIVYRLTPLGELFTELAGLDDGEIAKFFAYCADVMRADRTSTLQAIFCDALRACGNLQLSRRTVRTLLSLALVLGKFDVDGQGRALDAAALRLADEIKELEENRHERCRGYRTIGICAGLAVAVILL